MKRQKPWKPKFDFDSSIELTKNKLCPFCKNYKVDFLGLPKECEECVFEEDEEKETE